MNRSRWLVTICAGVLVGPATAEQARRPNLVIIMADDMGFSDIGCFGGEIRTPNLDALARAGLRFTQFYNTSRCCPTRASLLTGLYPHQAGVGHMMEDRGIPGYRGDLNRSSVTIAEVLKPSGYATLMAGKWHVCRPDRAEENGPIARGFDRHYGTIHGAGSFYDPVSLQLDGEPIAPEGDDYYYTDAIGSYASQFIREAPDDRPLFAYVALTAPHWPLHAPAEAIASYSGRYDEGWDVLRSERHRRMIDLGVVEGHWPLTPRDEEAPAWDEVPEVDRPWFSRRMEVYAAQVELMDRNVGRIVEALREDGRLEETLILFLADNGGCAEELGPSSHALYIPETTRDGRPVLQGNRRDLTPGPADTYQSYGLPWANASNTPFRRSKHWVHEGGISTPLIAHWPSGIPEGLGGSLLPTPGHLIDLMATCVDLGGARYPASFAGQSITPMAGKSLAPALQSGDREPHDAIFWEHEGNRAVRRGDWKLVSRHPGPWELYDLAADRTESDDLADRHPDVVAELSSLYDDWASRSAVVPWSDLPSPVR
ncbi:arylsulfatase [Tautonia plasticadhaerens]|uniref:Arylsulfatase n=1 Tax=Tautonia plasticadhaerens TaxID=2527974 RepID=A0A518GXJ4_9BACT|nr:arylsulfatase [Tautonia plasticadhaerens]QDV33309.1 Arylsulfatase [Tautonia plasticadhaerens]